MDRFYGVSLRDIIHADEEIHREMVRSLADREVQTFTSNLFGVLACAIVAMILPMSGALTVAIGLRLLAIAATRLASLHLAYRIKKRKPYLRALRLLGMSLCFSGATWAVLLWPIFGNTTVEPLAWLLIGLATVGVSLVAAVLGPLPKILLGFVASFCGTLAMGLFIHPTPVALVYILALAAIGGGVIAFSLGMARQAYAVSAVLVANHRLGEELTEALEQANFLSLHDPLTGLKNRRAFFEMEGWIAAQPVERHVLAIDLDHFKSINDRFGHAAGDRVLVEAARILRDVAREVPGGPHCAVRTGGEEFIVLLSGVDSLAAKGVAEIVLARMRSLDLSYIAPDLEISVSIGRAECAPDTSLEAALMAADKALFAAKRGGRNRIERAAA
ncbi:diguanylate cyclase [Altererythrobacter aurantiacus]|uniref:diguanylate cyclase n=1 Tax=Parapontixanthobacter aurantiacus TaxID=1463599 RepID=A0A844ZEZ4_9SPHN|nr:GGDEF domain-containing protein [Parapontixanthobacter aurantiacus]MXO85567.1 diguanylate cyclase [Parapontixanthobacter aurantiacus]